MQTRTGPTNQLTVERAALHSSYLILLESVQSEKYSLKPFIQVPSRLHQMPSRFQATG